MTASPDKTVKAAVGLSGGVDSAAAALLLRERGYEVAGVTMTLGRDDESESLSAAQTVAEQLGISLHVFDLAREWKKEVLDYLRGEYLAGRTPNPCVRCNERIKFGLLPRLAFDRLGCDVFATGHYARIVAGADGVPALRGRENNSDPWSGPPPGRFSLSET